MRGRIVSHRAQISAESMRAIRGGRMAGREETPREDHLLRAVQQIFGGLTG